MFRISGRKRETNYTTEKKNVYELIEAFELAKILVKLDYEREVRFFIDDMRDMYAWEVPQTYYIKKTKCFGEDMIIAGLCNGGEIKMDRLNDLKPAIRQQENASDLMRFIMPYLVERGVQKVTLIKKKKVR